MRPGVLKGGRGAACHHVQMTSRHLWTARLLRLSAHGVSFTRGTGLLTCTKITYIIIKISETMKALLLCYMNIPVVSTSVH